MTKSNSKITLKMIAAELGTTATTVSRVVSGQARKYRISKETEKKIVAVAKKLGFTPNQIARSLRTRKTYTIGLIVPNIANPFFSTIAQIIESAARLNNYSIILCDSGENTSVEIKSVGILENRVDGLIIAPVGKKDSHVKKVFERNLPIVLVDRYFPDLPISFVASNNYKGAFEAVSYLIECGHSKIACIQGLTDSFVSQERLRGYISALQSKKITVQNDLIKGNGFDVENGYLATKSLLTQQGIPTALFAQGNLIALGSLIAIKEEGYKVPDDISIIAFDDQPYLAFLSTPLSTIKQDSQKIGQIAVQMLLSQIKNGRPETNEKILLPCSIIHRNSVRKISVELKE
jgi:LacI family transcriptional regulator